MHILFFKILDYNIENTFSFSLFLFPSLSLFSFKNILREFLIPLTSLLQEFMAAIHASSFFTLRTILIIPILWRSCYCGLQFLMDTSDPFGVLRKTWGLLNSNYRTWLFWSVCPEANVIAYPGIHLNVQTDDTMHSTVNMNNMYLVLKVSWRLSGREGLKLRSDEKSSQGWGWKVGE